MGEQDVADQRGAFACRGPRHPRGGGALGCSARAPPVICGSLIACGRVAVTVAAPLFGEGPRDRAYVDHCYRRSVILEMAGRLLFSSFVYRLLFDCADAT